MENEQDRLLTISDLIANGYGKDFLYRVCHMENTPFFRTGKRGKFYVFEDKFVEFCSQRRVGK